MAFTQTNVRLIAGYSSIAQLGFITLGVFSLTADGANGAILQMVNHAIVVVPLFLIIVLLAERFGSEDLKQMGGGAMRAPVLAALFLIVTMATLAMPGSANFIGEFYILNGLFDAKTAFAVVATAGIAHGRLLRAADVPALDAQPASVRGDLARARPARRPRAGAARRRDPGACPSHRRRC